jgi:biotin synthase
MQTDSVSTNPAQRWHNLADRVLAGAEVSRDEALSILCSDDAELLDLLAATQRIRLHYHGKQVQLYFLQNAKSGLCPEDCHYCSQSQVSDAPIEKYAMLNEERLMEGARQAAESKARTYCIVASGRGPSNREVGHVANVTRRIKEAYGLHVCCCLGILNPEQAAELKAAGVDRINHNLNTSRRFHEQICTTHSFDDRLNTLAVSRDAGLELCAGLIVGMGEEADDVIDVAFKLRELKVESIPVNFLNAIEATPLEGTWDLDPRYCLKVLCLFRMTNPETEIRIAGGREVNLRSMQAMGLYAANSIFVSDYLTTQGQETSADFQMIEDLGFEIVFANQKPTASETVETS